MLDLPPTIHRVEWVNLHPEDQDLYEFFKQKTATIAAKMQPGRKSAPASLTSKGENILSLMNFLRRICDHGESLLPHAALTAWKARDDTSINLNMMRRLENSCRTCGSELQEANESVSKFKSVNDSVHCAACSGRNELSNDLAGENNSGKARSVNFAKRKSKRAEISSARPSAKIQALLRNLTVDQQNCDNQTRPSKRYVRSLGNLQFMVC